MKFEDLTKEELEELVRQATFGDIPSPERHAILAESLRELHQRERRERKANPSWFKKAVGLPIFALLTMITPCMAGELIPADKAAHMGAGFAGQVACEAVVNAIKPSDSVYRSLGCFVGIQALGVAKELTDHKRGGNRESLDVAANAVGGLLGLFTLRIGF